MNARKYAGLILAAVGLWIPQAWAIPATDLLCATTMPAFFSNGTRQCGGGKVQADDSTCFYQVPCLALTPERIAAIEDKYKKKYAAVLPAKNALTPIEKDDYVRLHLDLVVPVVVNCKGNPPAGENLFATCPPVEQCAQGRYVGFHPSIIDKKPSDPMTTTFIIEKNGMPTSAGPAK